MEHVIIYGQRVGDTVYIPADAIDIDAATKAGLLNERTIRLMTENGWLGKATPEVMKVAVARRPAGAPWPPRGFTEAYLLEKGLIEKDDIPGAPPPKEVASKQPPGRKATVVTHIKLTDAKIAVGKYFLQPRKNGHFTLYDAVDAEGRLLRIKGFRSKGDGEFFLNALSTDEAGADSQQAAASPESPDGSHVRPGTDGAEG